MSVSMKSPQSISSLSNVSLDVSLETPIPGMCYYLVISLPSPYLSRTLISFLFSFYYYFDHIANNARCRWIILSLLFQSWSFLWSSRLFAFHSYFLSHPYHLQYPFLSLLFFFLFFSFSFSHFLFIFLKINRCDGFGRDARTHE